MTVAEYIDKVNSRYKTGLTTEHSFRGDLQTLLESMLPKVHVTNEPTRINCGAPDYILTILDIPVGYIEAKDLGADLNSKNYKEQFERYKSALSNLIITNYLSFQLYKEGELVATYSIGEIKNGKVVAIPAQRKAFEAMIAGFGVQQGQTIKSSQKLAVMMANKAKLLAQVIEASLKSDEDTAANSSLKEQMQGFKDILIHDIKPSEFADIYAQTVAYGMFAARLHDTSLDTFTRREAAELIPRSNPFLRRLFDYIAGIYLDERIVWIVDALADIFRATDVAALLKNFGKATQQQDPIIHFYETFLTHYDPNLRKDRGVWYTPEPVVKFIVRAVDDILKTEFGLKDGLADTSKTKIKVKVASNDKRTSGYKELEQEVHKVQILDPATGTGTFLAEVVKYIHNYKFDGQQGIWSSYVENHLIPRINGFELLMASYAMAHLQLDLLLTETGYKATKEQRFRIYLTNSLEEHHPDTGTIFASWLSDEANEANKIKRDVPVMVVMGNPPYSGISSNNGDWISKLIEDYKYVDGEHFNERKHWLNDDYVKFIRFGQHFIEKNGEGILAFINPHGFLDNTTFRGMRWNLLKTYDSIYTIDLHGNTKKVVVTLEGKDENVFNIMQGVAITVFIKTGKKKTNEFAKIFYHSLRGPKTFKYDYLSNNRLQDITFQELKPTKPFFFFIPRNEKGLLKYSKGFRVDDIFPVNVTGIVTARDGLVINENKENLKKNIHRFIDDKYSDDETRAIFFGTKKDGKYKAGDSRGWSLAYARQKIKNNKHDQIIRKITYRPFDDRYIYYTSDMVDWGREKFMYHFIEGENIGLDLCRQLVSSNYSHVMVTNAIVDDSFVSNKSRERGYVFPLYLYPEKQRKLGDERDTTKRANLNMNIVEEFENSMNLYLVSDNNLSNFEAERDNRKKNSQFSPLDMLDYIYSVLHSPAYREKYKEFLKIDFPRVPYPDDAKKFWQLVKLGSEIRKLHLLESERLNKLITRYPSTGDNEVDKPKYEDGKVYINGSQYFDNVPEVAWNFYIGGYQPAQKWLKDRKGRQLSFDDILHYQKMIVALTETDKLMKEIDEVGVV